MRWLHQMSPNSESGSFLLPATALSQDQREKFNFQADMEGAPVVIKFH